MTIQTVLKCKKDVVISNRARSRGGAYWGQMPLPFNSNFLELCSLVRTIIQVSNAAMSSAFSGPL